MSVCLPPGRAAKCLIMGSAFGATHNADFAFPAFLSSSLPSFISEPPTRNGIAGSLLNQIQSLQTLRTSAQPPLKNGKLERLSSALPPHLHSFLPSACSGSQSRSSRPEKCRPSERSCRSFLFPESRARNARDYIPPPPQPPPPPPAPPAEPFVLPKFASVAVVESGQ